MDICNFLFYQVIMSLKYHHAYDVLKFVYNETDSCALVCVKSVSGGSMRSVGSLMAVKFNGDCAGYISNGCIDADIVYQSKSAISENKIRTIKYGKHSEYKDIKLPCGGSIELIIIPNPNRKILGEAIEALKSRKEFILKLNGYKHKYSPKLQLKLFGRDEALYSLASLALEVGFEVHIYSQDQSITDELKFSSFTHLSNPENPVITIDDNWTAVVLLFHDHDWEINILKQVAAGDAFYIGAMGSVKTHKLRLENLSSVGVSLSDISKIKGPIGLIPSMRDTNFLALSTLAEVVKVAKDKNLL